MISKKLLLKVAKSGQLSAEEFLTSIENKSKDYRDYYPAAALLHAGLVSTDSKTELGGESKRGTLGLDMKDTAEFLQQLMLDKGDSFEVDGCPRESAKGFPVTFFITAEGYVKLEEILDKEQNKRQKRLDYMMSFIVAIFTAVLSSSLFHHFALERAGNIEIEQTKNTEKISEKDDTE